MAAARIHSGKFDDGPLDSYAETRLCARLGWFHRTGHRPHLQRPPEWNASPAAVGLPALLKMRYRVLGGFRVLRFLLGAFFLDGLDRLLCQVLVGCLVRHGVLLTAGDGLRPSS